MCHFLILVVHYFCFFVCSKLEKQKEKKRKEEQKRKIASLSFNPEDEGEEEEENEEEEQECEYGCRSTNLTGSMVHSAAVFYLIFVLRGLTREFSPKSVSLMWSKP